MAQARVHLALFKDVEPATEAIGKLRSLGIPDRDMTIISGTPFSSRVLARPQPATRVPQFGIAGFLFGFVVSLLLNWGTPLSYPLIVGGQPLLAIPPTAVLTFEISMLGLLVFTFLGVIWESAFPSFGPSIYTPKVSDGRIAVVFSCAASLDNTAYDAMKALGAEVVEQTEAKKL